MTTPSEHSAARPAEQHRDPSAARSAEQQPDPSAAQHRDPSAQHRDPSATRPAEQHGDPSATRPAEQQPDPSATRSAEQRPAEHLRADARQNRARLISAATAAFAEKGADAPLEDIARRAGVGIGTLYRHFPNRLDLQAAVFRTQVRAVCDQGDALLADESPELAFAAWAQALAGYLVTKRGLSRALIDAVGVESELITSCWLTMRETTERLLAKAQQAKVIRSDVTSMDVMRLLHGVAVSSERDPDRLDLLLSVTLDGLAAKRGRAKRG